MAQIRKRETARGLRYDVRYRLGGRTMCEVFNTYEAARQRSHKIETERSLGVAIDPKGPQRRLEEVATAWLESNPAKRANTRATDERMLQAHVFPVLGTRKIGSLATADVQSLVNEWTASAAPRTVRRRFGVLRAVLNFAVASDWLGRSPCRSVKLPSPTSTRRYQLGADDVAAIAEAIDKRYRPMVWVGAVLGLRWSEVAALRVGRIDMLGRTLTVAEAVGRDASGRPVLTAPKSTASKRTLSMPPALATELAKHLAELGFTGADRDALLFEAPEGGPMRYSNWRRRFWLPAAEKAGCQGAGFHDLRRANATAMVSGHVDVRTAQARLGHTDPRLTLAVYAQAVESSDRNAAEVVGSHFMPVVSRKARQKRAKMGA